MYFISKYVIIRILTFYKSHLILFLAVCQILYQMAYPHSCSLSIPSAFILLPEISDPIPEVGCGQSPQKAIIMMPYLSCKKIENDVYNFPTWQYCKYKDIFDSRIIINSTAKFYISISYQKDLLSIDTRIFTPSNCPMPPFTIFLVQS